MSTHKRLFKVANILNRPWSKFLVRVDLYSGFHSVGLDGIQKHFIVEVKFGKGAGYNNGSTLYLARNCFDRSYQNIRKPIQFGLALKDGEIPYAD